MLSLRKIICVAFLGMFTACNNDPKKEDTSATTGATEVQPKISVPVFDADSAYAYVDKVASFGPRVPGTKAQEQCAAWMSAKLKALCDTVYVQDVDVTTGDNKQMPCFNIIGSINPTAKRRILFLTHWDSRPWADQDTKDKDKPIIAADDGGSGVGVLMEIARQLKANKLPADAGIDILLEDVEDYGREAWGEQSYCLGTQYWAKHPHIPGYTADFGVLLDMVGARNAQFPLEGSSAQRAGGVQQNIWQAARRAGYSSFFVYQQGPQITDDHIPVMNFTGIKTVDIINLDLNGNRSFASHWHTHNDNMQIIDKATLKAVGQTLLQVICEHASGM